MLVCVLPEQVAPAWSRIGHIIEQALKRGGMGDAAAVYADVIAGRSLLWMALEGEQIQNAAAVTDLTEANGKKICTIVGCGGEPREAWFGLLGDLEEYARREGCAEMRIIGRVGWKRLLPDYQERAIILTKGLP